MSDTIEVCVDCLYLVELGDLPGEHTPEDVAAHAARMDAWDGYTLSSTGYGEGHFSWRECEGCESTLGGDRFTMHFRPNDATHCTVCELFATHGTDYLPNREA